MKATLNSNAVREDYDIPPVTRQTEYELLGTHPVNQFVRKARLLGAGLTLIGSLCVAHAQTSVVLAWNSDSDPTVTGYDVVYGTSSSNLNLTQNAGTATSATVSNLAPGQTYYFAAKAYNAQGETSVPSNIVSYTASAPTPTPTPAPTPTPTPVPTPTPTPRLTPTPTPVPTPTPTPRPTPTPTPVPTPTPTPQPTPTSGPTVTIFGATAPSNPAQTFNDGAAVELGVKFTPSTSGTITGIRFYKANSNTGTHIGDLWSASGKLLATAAFSGETASGWQQVNLSTPVAITAGSTYIVSYHTNIYSVDAYYFDNAATSGPLTAPASSSCGGNGVYVYSNSSAFPTNTWEASNYWVDVAFVPGASGPGPVIDTETSSDQQSASSNVSTAAFSTNSANELLLAFVAADYLSGPNTTVNSLSGAGLNWALVNRTNTQAGTSEIWRAFAPTPLSNVNVTASLSQSVVSSITLVTFKGVNTTGTNGSGAIGALGTSNASQGAPTASLVTTKNNSWVIGVGNDYDNALGRTVPNGQSLVHQDFSSTGDTYWVQMQSSAIPYSGTNVLINDTAPSTDRYNLSIVEVLAAP
ncbi:MAG: DUF4082 domain-containing protein [Verrucomicrobia bacterium]|nr:DUF4082 domain-containing protein [Verrucomicrobiota bacterium]